MTQGYLTIYSLLRIQSRVGMCFNIRLKICYSLILSWCYLCPHDADDVNKVNKIITVLNGFPFHLTESYIYKVAQHLES